VSILNDIDSNNVVTILIGINNIYKRFVIVRLRHKPTNNIVVTIRDNTDNQVLFIQIERRTPPQAKHRANIDCRICMWLDFAQRIGSLLIRTCRAGVRLTAGPRGSVSVPVKYAPEPAPDPTEKVPPFWLPLPERLTGPADAEPPQDGPKKALVELLKLTCGPALAPSPTAPPNVP